MAVTVVLYSIADEFSEPEYQSPLKEKSDDTFATFRVLLEGEGLVDYPFDFWIQGDKRRMLPRFEKFNTVGEEVIVIPRIDGQLDSRKRRRAGEMGRSIVSDSEVFPAPLALENEATFNDDEDLTQPADSARVGDDDHHAAPNHLRSQLITPEIMKRYQHHVEKLKKELAAVALDDNIWYLKSWDQNGVGIVKNSLW